jgi:uncharacterized protein Yka (UPF0111/DUF47 family)
VYESERYRDAMSIDSIKKAIDNIIRIFDEKSPDIYENTRKITDRSKSVAENITTIFLLPFGVYFIVGVTP